MKITIRPEGDEKNLLVLLQKKGVAVSAPCGGNGHCGRCKVIVGGAQVLACQTSIEAETEVDIPESGGILSETDVVQTGVFYKKDGVFAVDIGTTTVAVALIDGDKAVEVVTFDNPQLPFGADVLSRIQSAGKFGARALQEPLLYELKNAVGALCEKYSCRAKELFVCGNTVMLHLFWGEDVRSLGVAPYTPVFTEKRTGKLPAFGNATVTSLPCISSYVGADIVAGITTVPTPAPGKNALLIDLGTNAEIALVGEKDVLVTSAAAGPCFEAGNVSCGMPARDGAVVSFALTDGKGVPTYIGKTPLGVCGTGLIDVVGQLARGNVIDKTGYLTYEKGYPIANNVILTQQDVRAFQTAKSALRSGVDVLLQEAGATYDDIEKVYLAGGFSAKIDVHNAALAGLIAPPLQDKCIAVKNSALAGLLLYINDPDKAEKVASSARSVDLAESRAFSEAFIKNLNFD